MTVIKINIYPEICCEYCMEIIHNHFDCPICHAKYVPTDIYGDIQQDIRDKGEVIITCEECGASFKCKSSENYQEGIWEVIQK